MYIKFFSHDVSNFDSLPAEVVRSSKKGCYIVAEACDGQQITGFCKTMAPVGSKLYVTAVNEFPDGGFFFILDSIQYPDVLPWGVIKGAAPRTNLAIAS